MSLSHYCSNIPYIVKSMRKGNISYGIEFSTRTLPCFNELHTLFYKNNKKVIPDNIYNLLNPIAIAH
jgi:LAGLIDADG DNA endonuclease family